MGNIEQASGSRRPLKSRQTRWAAACARWLTQTGISPNAISVASAFFCALAGACLILTGGATANWMKVFLFIAAAACLQLRLLCNLFDGMVAVEGGFRTKSGEIFNDLPDRFADAIIFVCGGYAVGPSVRFGIELGWLTAVLAVLVAYVRVLGASAGAGHCFAGPMAKQHRMALMTAACLLSIAEVYLWPHGRVLALALALISLGCAITIIRRMIRVIRELESK